MKIENTAIAAVQLIHQFNAKDERGSFIKTFQQNALKQQGIHFELRESFYSISKMGVIRGMHFHHPPYDHDKIVFCTQGCILDVALDLRKNEISYGQFISTELSDSNCRALFIPKGFAHGFQALTDDTITYYLVSGEYNQQADDGILYNSFGVDWPIDLPLLSTRDLSFSTLQNFNSPF